MPAKAGIHAAMDQLIYQHWGPADSSLRGRDELKGFQSLRGYCPAFFVVRVDIARLPSLHSP